MMSKLGWASGGGTFNPIRKEQRPRGRTENMAACCGCSKLKQHLEKQCQADELTDEWLRVTDITEKPPKQRCGFSDFKRDWLAWVLWLTPIILSTPQAEIRRIEVWSQPRQIVCETLSWKKTIWNGWKSGSSDRVPF
jgi:hypothetical protein